MTVHETIRELITKTTELQNIAQRVSVEARAFPRLWDSEPQWQGDHFTHLFGAFIDEQDMQRDGDATGRRMAELKRRVNWLKVWGVHNAVEVEFSLVEVTKGLPGALIDGYRIPLIARFNGKDFKKESDVGKWAKLLAEYGAIAFSIDGRHVEKDAATAAIKGIREVSERPIIYIAGPTDNHAVALGDGEAIRVQSLSEPRGDAESVTMSTTGNVSDRLSRQKVKRVMAYVDVSKVSATPKQTVMWLTPLGAEWSAAVAVLERIPATAIVADGWDANTEWTNIPQLLDAMLGYGLRYWIQYNKV